MPPSSNIPAGADGAENQVPRHHIQTQGDLPGRYLFCGQYRPGNVGYYAEKPALSPKYLSALMKEVGDLSAAEWIDPSDYRNGKV